MHSRKALQLSASRSLTRTVTATSTKATRSLRTHVRANNLRATKLEVPPLNAPALRFLATRAAEPGYEFSSKWAPPFTTLVELMDNAAVMHGDRPALGVKKDGVYSYYTYTEVHDLVQKCRSALVGMGVGKDDKVGIIARNRLEWVVTAYAAYSVGAAHVPMYEQQKSSEWEYIAEDSGIKVVFASTDRVYDMAKPFEGKVGKVERVIGLDLPEAHSDSWDGFIAAGAQLGPVPAVDVSADDLAGLIYTSGTTGKPKGVMLTHKNLCENVKSVLDHNKGDVPLVTPEDRSVAFLPWAHSYGQTCELHSGIAIGASTAIAAGAPGDAVELLTNIGEVKPTVLFSVPTLFKKVYDGVNVKIAEETGLKKTLMTSALSTAAEVRRRNVEGLGSGMFLGAQHAVLDRLVLSKIRERFGGRLKIAFTAGAATPVEVIEFMESLGIQMTEGYGLTETAPVVAITHPAPTSRVTGSVGTPVPRVQMKLVMDGREVGPGEEGELWVAGPNIMSGYWQRPEETAEVIVEGEDGIRWFRTGDLASLVPLNDELHIKITGRIKEQYKLENGKYVVPGPIEEAICLGRLVNQAVVYGDGRPHNVALLVPEYAILAADLGLPDPGTDAAAREALCSMPEAQALVAQGAFAELEKRDVKKYEWPKKFALLSEPFSADNQMLTPKLSVRKPNVIKAYTPTLHALYDDAAVGVGQEDVEEKIAA